MQEEEFRRNCELRAKDEPVTNQQAIEALDHIVKNPRRDAEDTRTLNQAVSVLENFIYIHAGTESKALDTTMQEDIEDNKPHLCVPTLDGNAHVIPAEVFDKIVSGEMKITDMEDWEIITRTAFSEWLRGLETAAKARVYKVAIDQLADSMAAGAWQDGPAPKDGSHILALFRGEPYVVYWDSWQTGETIPGEGTYIDGEESGWIIARNGDALIDDAPEKWARIIHPNRHMPASWDGPGDRG